MSLELEEKLKSAFQKYLPHLLVGLALVMLTKDVFGPHGYLAMRKKNQEIQKVNAELNRLNQENAALDQDVKDLKTDPHAIAKIAREELGLAAPGEVIIKLPPQAPAEPPVVKP
jgi:cell division protein FtsL